MLKCVNVQTVVSREGEELEVLTAVLEEVYRRLEVFIRKLYMMADTERRWQTELEDHGQPDMDLIPQSEAGPPFFHDYHLQVNILSVFSSRLILCHLISAKGRKPICLLFDNNMSSHSTHLFG